MSARKKKSRILPVVALRGMNVFPGTAVHFDIERDKSIAAVEAAMGQLQEVLLVAQKNDNVDAPSIKDLENVGVFAEIKQVMSLPGGNLRVLADCIERGSINNMLQSSPYMNAEVYGYCKIGAADKAKIEPMVRTALKLLKEYSAESIKLPPDTVDALLAIADPEELCDGIASNVFVRREDKSAILNTLDIAERYEKLVEILTKEIVLCKEERQIQMRVKDQIEQNQKDYFLREQIRAIQVELGDTDSADNEEYRKRLEASPMNQEAKEKCEKEISRLSQMAPGSPEISMSKSYIEWILDMPWGVMTEDNLDLKNAREVLDSNHYGLSKVKDRIIEYLAVLKLKRNMSGPILCFVGPPGVGKTSIVRAIAEATGRKFVQMSLGGVQDEAEIRGHRRTYIGAIPGRIIYNMKQAGSMNPVFLFDEIDKMSHDFRGDPASAMLEVLDSEQNENFRDHYMEIPFDLSKVMFITTANSANDIPAPLLDRMEVIEVPSYTEEEKLQIACKHLYPKQLKANGLDTPQVEIGTDVMNKIIEGYTREAGVRTLERTVAKVIRKGIVAMQETGKKKILVSEKIMEQYLGAPRYTRQAIEKEPAVGVVNGLAYTTFGGEMLEIECSVMPGKGGLKLTGQLGDVMKESAEAAYSWVRANGANYGITSEFYKDCDVHIHVPEGAVPKDGPSAGVTMATALVSALSGRKVRQNVAMTGEISLRGKVMPIGGLKEKSLAAYRAGISTLIIPAENEKDLEEIPAEVLSAFKIVKATQLSDVLKAALVSE